jgi:hypothetical protein
MRDPDLVQRAERAATALEQAWMSWREQHGLGADRLPPVSSYVGYSVEEPWGQPRVVLGIDADGAEQLAALINGHDCVGPVHAGVIARPERRQQPATTGQQASASAAGEAGDQAPDPASGQPVAAIRDPDPSAPAAELPAAGHAGRAGLVALRPRAVPTSSEDAQASVPAQAAVADAETGQPEPVAEESAAVTAV